MNMTTSENLLSEIIDELRPLPHAQRKAAARVYRQMPNLLSWYNGGVGTARVT